MTNATRIVADADVLASDLLTDGPSRAALDIVRSHSWLTLIASPILLDDAETVIGNLTSPDLATNWREKIDSLVHLTEHPSTDHPAIASAYNGNAHHIVSLDPALQSAQAGVMIREHVETSVKHPAAFNSLFDPEPIYEELTNTPYPGPDTDPRD